MLVHPDGLSFLDGLILLICGLSFSIAVWMSVFVTQSDTNNEKFLVKMQQDELNRLAPLKPFVWDEKELYPVSKDVIDLRNPSTVTIYIPDIPSDATSDVH